jgi:hypothetical protein
MIAGDLEIKYLTKIWVTSPSFDLSLMLATVIRQKVETYLGLWGET